MSNMKQIIANAPTPGDIMELAKENERLKLIEKNLHNFLFDNASKLNDKHLNELSRLLSDKT